MKPMIRIHDIETNEFIDREMTDAEFTEYEADQANVMAEQKAKSAAIAAKEAAEAKLATLGLTSDDLRALGL